MTLFIIERKALFRFALFDGPLKTERISVTRKKRLLSGSLASKHSSDSIGNSALKRLRALSLITNGLRPYYCLLFQRQTDGTFRNGSSELAVDHRDQVIVIG